MPVCDFQPPCCPESFDHHAGPKVGVSSQLLATRIMTFSMNSLFFQVHAFCFQGATNNQPEILSQVQFLMFYPIGLDPSPKPVGVQKESSPIKKINTIQRIHLGIHLGITFQSFLWCVLDPRILVWKDSNLRFFDGKTCGISMGSSDAPLLTQYWHGSKATKHSLIKWTSQL